ncbi:hypothetical protein MBRU_18575 [Mycolicibacterium brumae DSM 44177]|nr:hypothetical protein MBRU_18575 [Mycolicibacterium brumae DSM 44177]
MFTPEGPASPLSDDRGAATVLAAICVLIILCCTGFGAALGSAVIARHRAQSAADLAALAAANALSAGPQAACAQARQITDAANAHLAQCQTENLDVIVTVEIPVPLRLPGNRTAQARARAGPADMPG